MVLILLCAFALCMMFCCLCPCRKPALIAEMLAALQRIAPQQQQQQQQQQVPGRGQQDGQTLAATITKMSLTLVDNVTK
jgi:hypothetical protein